MKMTIIVAEVVLADTVDATASLLLYLPRNSASLSVANRRRARPTAIRACLLAPLVVWQLELWVEVWLEVLCVCRPSTPLEYANHALFSGPNPLQSIPILLTMSNVINASGYQCLMVRDITAKESNTTTARLFSLGTVIHEQRFQMNPRPVIRCRAAVKNLCRRQGRSTTKPMLLIRKRNTKRNMRRPMPTTSLEQWAGLGLSSVRFLFFLS